MAKLYKLQSVPMVIREYREAAGLTQEELSERLDCHNTYISQLETGKSYPSIGMLIKIAHALKVDPGSIVNTIDLREQQIDHLEK